MTSLKGSLGKHEDHHDIHQLNDEEMTYQIKVQDGLFYESFERNADAISIQELHLIEDSREGLPTDASEKTVGINPMIATEEGDSVEDETSPWLRPLEEHTLPEFHGQVPVPTTGTPWYKALRAYLGPGTLVAVGYMDPGNWVTDIAGGSAFGFKLLFVIAMSSLMAMFLQYLSLKAGLATNRDLAQICRDSYPRPVVIMLWIIMEIAICATDLAEVLGSAIAFKLLFNIPLVAGVCITAVDVLFILFLNGSKFEWMERLVSFLILIILVCFTIQLGYSHPNGVDVMAGFLPSKELFTNNEMLFVGVGIIGATVMPHNLFLHSSIILTRDIPRDEASIKEAIHYSRIDTILSLTLAFFVNAAILMVAAATFYTNGYHDIASLEDAYKLLEPILHSKVAPVVFGIALLAAGQNSTLTGTLTGQIVMEGFMNYKISPTFRRLLTRLMAIVPAIIVTAVGGDKETNNMLLISQVVLSFALPFAVVPLVHVTSSRLRMGKFANSPLVNVVAVILSAIIIVLNVVLLV
jgi:manganese transport protein